MKASPTQKSRYFLAELIVNCLFFVISASICLNLFAFGYTQSTESKNLSMATLKAQNMAECIKASGQDIDLLCELTGAVQDENLLVIYYDDEWEISNQEAATYEMNVLIDVNSLGMLYADIAVFQAEEIIFDLKVNKYLEEYVAAFS